MIGFEFETSVPMKWSDGGMRDKEDALFSLQAGITWGYTWKAVSDSGNLEIVTEPFNDEAVDRNAEVGRMIDVFADIGRFLDLLLTRPKRAAPGPPEDITLEAKNLLGIARLANAGKKGVYFVSPTTTSLMASPQATIGFTLDKIYTAAIRIVNTKLHFFDEDERVDRQREDTAGISLSGMHPVQGALLLEAAVRAREEVTALGAEQKNVPAQALDAYEGFLTIVISYLLMGSRQVRDWQYYKLIAPLMSRVSLHKMLQDEQVQPVAQFFTAERVLSAAGLDSDGTSMLYRIGVSGKANITRKQWIDSIIAGKDMLAQLDKNDTGSMSARDDDDDRTATGKKIYQLELRRLPNAMEPKNWVDLAISLYDISRRWHAAG